MTFQGFTKNDFDTFIIDGLEGRMKAIRERIQPKFSLIGEDLRSDLTAILGNEMYLHIAQHARRTVNAPKDTWLAIASNKRGYKQHPHFQVGLFDDHLFIWLAFIYEMPTKKEIAQTFLTNYDQVNQTIPDNFVISLDHMNKNSHGKMELGEDGLKNALIRFRDVKKAEFLIGRHLDADDPILTDGVRLMNLMRETMTALIPLYLLSYST